MSRRAGSQSPPFLFALCAALRGPRSGAVPLHGPRDMPRAANAFTGRLKAALILCPPPAPGGAPASPAAGRIGRSSSGTPAPWRSRTGDIPETSRRTCTGPAPGPAWAAGNPAPPGPLLPAPQLHHLPDFRLTSTAPFDFILQESTREENFIILENRTITAVWRGHKGPGITPRPRFSAPASPLV